MYHITSDLAACRLDIDFIDSYTDIDQAQLTCDLRAGALKVKAGGSHFDLLVDFTRVPVMPRGLTLSGREEIGWCIAHGLRRSANVIISTIAKMQIQRLSGNDRFRMFATRVEALAWLRSAD